MMLDLQQVMETTQFNGEGNPFRMPHARDKESPRVSQHTRRRTPSSLKLRLRGTWPTQGASE
jgi:hypothetical protein